MSKLKEKEAVKVEFKHLKNLTFKIKSKSNDDSTEITAIWLCLDTSSTSGSTPLIINTQEAKQTILEALELPYYWCISDEYQFTGEMV